MNKWVVGRLYKSVVNYTTGIGFKLKPGDIVYCSEKVPFTGSGVIRLYGTDELVSNSFSSMALTDSNRMFVEYNNSYISPPEFFITRKVK